MCVYESKWSAFSKSNMYCLWLNILLKKQFEKTKNNIEKAHTFRHIIYKISNETGHNSLWNKYFKVEEKERKKGRNARHRLMIADYWSWLRTCIPYIYIHHFQSLSSFPFCHCHSISAKYSFIYQFLILNISLIHI